MNECSVEQQIGLIDAIAQGDQSAFEQLYRLTSPDYSPSHYESCVIMPGQKKFYMTVSSASGIGREITTRS